MTVRRAPRGSGLAAPYAVCAGLIIAANQGWAATLAYALLVGPLVGLDNARKKAA